MPTILLLYPAYGLVSCHEVSRYAEGMEDLRLILSDNDPTPSDEDIFDEVMELPPPENVAESFDLLRRWCAKHKPDGIFLQSERGLLLGSLLAREFGLRGPSIEAAHLCSNKYLQRVAVSQAHLGNPAFALADNATEVHRLAADFGFPIVLKCVISTMSRLVTLVRSQEEVDGAVERLKVALTKSVDVARLVSFAQAGNVDLGCDPARQFLVESFLDGDFVETDGLVIGREPFTFGVTEQIQSVDPPFFIEGYLYPAECADNKPIEHVSDEILKAIGLTDSGFSIELRLLDGEVRLMEINGRLGWDDGFSDMFQVRTHQQRIFQCLQMALGIKPDIIHDTSRFAALAYRPCYYNGLVDDLPTREQLMRLERDDIRFGLSTHIGAHFVAPPNPEAYPHVLWALATHPKSSHAAYAIARQAVDELPVSIRHT